MRKSFLPRKNKKTKKPESLAGIDDLFKEEFANYSIPVQNHEHESSDAWLDNQYEGQLSVDVFQNNDEIIIRSTMAGVDENDLDIFVENDMLTIRGKRSDAYSVAAENYFFRECYWGGFSRSIILPLEVDYNRIDASLHNGVLTIRIPKSQRNQKINVNIVD